MGTVSASVVNLIGRRWFPLSVPNNNAFPVTHRFVKSNGRLFPVTHSFVVKRGEGSGEDDLLDDFQGEILECYNAWSIGHPRRLGIGPSIGTIGTCSYEMTYAVINLEHRVVNFGFGPEYYGDGFGPVFQRVVGGEGWWEAAPPYSGIGWAISTMPAFHHIPDSPQLIFRTMQSVTSLSVTISGGTVMRVGGFGWWPDWIGQRNKDKVFWLYKYRETTPGGIFEFDPALLSPSVNTTWGVPSSDELFQPGQSGFRLISNQWKYAPWERYPHLL
jgi:hypothetical protein